MALTLTFAADSQDPSIAEGETVAYTDSQGRLLELTTSRGFSAPPHIVRQAREQDRWIELTVPVEIVAWRNHGEAQ